MVLLYNQFCQSINVQFAGVKLINTYPISAGSMAEYLIVDWITWLFCVKFFVCFFLNVWVNIYRKLSQKQYQHQTEVTIWWLEREICFNKYHRNCISPFHMWAGQPKNHKTQTFSSTYFWQLRNLLHYWNEEWMFQIPDTHIIACPDKTMRYILMQSNIPESQAGKANAACSSVFSHTK